MRIMIGSESFYPNVSGVAVAALNLAAYLAAQGHEVLVLAPSTRMASYLESYPADFSVQRLASVANPFRRGFRFTVYPLKQVDAAVKSWQPDIVHLQDPTSIGSCLLRSANKRGIPVVINHHFTLEYILSYVRFLKPLHRRLRTYFTDKTRAFYNRCQYVICPSETVKAWLLSIGVEVPVAVISNGVDLHRFFSYELPVGIRLDLHLPNLPIILYVGRIDVDKSLDTLMDAVPLVLARHQAHFVLCGGGNKLEHFRKKAEKQGLKSQVTFLGQLDHASQDLPRLYQIAACFVMPSMIETQSIVTMEAMASGLPIVAAAAGALPELVTDGDNGCLFAPGDAVDLADKINLLLGNESLRLRLGIRSLEKIIEHDLNRNLHKIELVYSEVVGHA